MAYKQRRYLQEQEISFDAGYVRRVQRTLVSHKRQEELYLFRTLNLTRSTTYQNASWLWLVAGVLFFIGALVNVLDGVDREEFSNIGVGGLFGIGLVGFWVVRRTAWAGYSPLIIWDLGPHSSHILDEVHRRRLRHLVDEVAVQNVDWALDTIRQFESGGLMSAELAEELRTLVTSSRYKPGGYL